ncbi:uncharacterized protein METZ01_LOCUS16934 [marine metagenome]|uniref:Uncharacterized protein n=1 Tax=marine metagenome TaxID=408172 RepID=A0A381PAU7_9ZZZZ
MHIEIRSKFAAFAAAAEYVAKHLLIAVKHRHGCISLEFGEKTGFVEKSSSLVGIFDEYLEVTVDESRESFNGGSRHRPNFISK